MKDEIKEILQMLEAMASNDDVSFLPRQASKLLDYITNLQEKNEKLKELKNLYREKLISKFCTNKRAIEYIKEKDWYLPLWECKDNQPNKDDLLNILQGEDTTPENLYKYSPEKGFRLVGDDNEY